LQDAEEFKCTRIDDGGNWLNRGGKCQHLLPKYRVF
jgi:hypothetical protein